MRILIAPLNWGLGHASRCVPLVRRLLDEGHEVVLGGDGDSLTLLRKHFPSLRYVRLAPLNLRYSAGKRQVWAMIKALPQLLAWAVKDHIMLRALLREEHFDQVISDNRFGLYAPDRHRRSGSSAVLQQRAQTQSVYITHQLHIMLPKGWKWLEPLASRLHARIYAHYDKVWVPDYEDPEKSLSGELGHPPKSFVLRPKSFVLGPLSLSTLTYIGPLSRFSLTAQRSYSAAVLQHSGLTAQRSYTTVALLSGLEPQRTLLEKEIITRYARSEENVLIIQGLPARPKTRVSLPCGEGRGGVITIVPHLPDSELAGVLLQADHIIARSGYSTIMDLAALGLLTHPSLSPSLVGRAGAGLPHSRLELIPTPGQPEQEYLARFLAEKKHQSAKK